MTPTAALLAIAFWAVLIVAWALCAMAADTDPERTPPAARTRTADPGAAPSLSTASGEAGGRNAARAGKARP